MQELVMYIERFKAIDDIERDWIIFGLDEVYKWAKFWDVLYISAEPAIGRRSFKFERKTPNLHTRFAISASALRSAFARVEIRLFGETLARDEIPELLKKFREIKFATTNE